MAKKLAVLLTLLIVAVAGFFIYKKLSYREARLKLYWLIPDGVRNEPNLFNMYEWAREGKLPNIKKLMDRGSYGYSNPNFPSHTPTNFATLLTGAYPEVHGIDDGPMHTIGKPLDAVAVGGFRSVARKVPAIWKTLEDDGMKVAVLSVPGSTPPEIQKGVVVHGRWGNWGADFNAINFETKGDLSQRIKQGRGARWFYFGPELTQYLDGVTPSGWQSPPESFSPPLEVSLTAYGATVYGYIADTTNDGQVNYDRVSLSRDKKNIFATLKQGEWSAWEPVTLTWKVGDKATPVNTSAKIALIKLDGDGFFRFRIDYDNLNSYVTMPASAASVLESTLGPLVDFPDNFPAQLIYYPEDKKIFMDEADMSFAWHTGAVAATVKSFNPDVVIHDIYTPNQMLTSRWWMGYVDPASTRYGNVSAKERQQLWDEVSTMYKKLDTMVGEVLKNSGDNTYIVFSSDHGAVPINKYVNLNNIFASKGWLKFTINPQTGEPVIDWANTKVIYLKMAHVYINPNGLAGNYERAHGPAYEDLRSQVMDTLMNLKDGNGVKPLSRVDTWENAKTNVRLDPDRAGDLIIANTAGYGWNEEMSQDLAYFSDPLISGYKQAIQSLETPGMWTPFIIAGPGIKRNNFLGDKPFPLVNQYPTIMKALKEKIPSFVEGKSLDVFTDGR